MQETPYQLHGLALAVAFGWPENLVELTGSKVHEFSTELLGFSKLAFHFSRAFASVEEQAGLG